MTVKGIVICCSVDNKVLAGYADAHGHPLIDAQMQLTNDGSGLLDLAVGRAASSSQQQQLTAVDLDGRIRDWSQLVLVFAVILKKLSYSGNESVLVAVPAEWHQHPDTMCHLMKMFMEELKCQQLYIGDHTLMTMYGYGQHLTGLVVTLCDQCVMVQSVVDAVVSLPQKLYGVGKQMLRNQLQILLKSDKLFMGNNSLQQQLLLQNAAFLDHVLDEVCQVQLSDSQIHHLQKVTSPAKKNLFQYQGVEYQISDPHKVYECLFKPPTQSQQSDGSNNKQLSSQQQQIGLAEFVCQAVGRHLEYGKRCSLMDNLVLCGFSDKMLRSLKTRLDLELKKYISVSEFTNEQQPREVRYGQFPRYLHGEDEVVSVKIAPYLGASICSKFLFADQKNFVTAEEYEQLGPASCLNKLF